MASPPTIIFKPVELAIAKLDLKPGQLLIVEFPEETSRSDIELVADQIRDLDLKVRVWLIRGGIKISVAEMKDG